MAERAERRFVRRRVANGTHSDRLLIIEKIFLETQLQAQIANTLPTLIGHSKCLFVSSKVRSCGEPLKLEIRASRFESREREFKMAPPFVEK